MTLCDIILWKADPEESIFLNKCGSGRYQSKRQSGISDQRTDGSFTSENNDIQSTYAEYYGVNKKCLQTFNSGVFSRKGDDGFDGKLGNVKIGVVWLGTYKDGRPRFTNGNLIINPHEKHRWCDIYMCIGGNTEVGFAFVGWALHTDVVSLPKVNFGYGERFAMPIKQLFRTDMGKAPGVTVSYSILPDDIPYGIG